MRLYVSLAFAGMIFPIFGFLNHKPYDLTDDVTPRKTTNPKSILNHSNPCERLSVIKEACKSYGLQNHIYCMCRKYKIHETWLQCKKRRNPTGEAAQRNSYNYPSVSINVLCDQDKPSPVNFSILTNILQDINIYEKSERTLYNVAIAYRKRPACINCHRARYAEEKCRVSNHSRGSPSPDYCSCMRQESVQFYLGECSKNCLDDSNPDVLELYQNLVHTALSRPFCRAPPEPESGSKSSLAGYSITTHNSRLWETYVPRIRGRYITSEAKPTAFGAKYDSQPSLAKNYRERETAIRSTWPSQDQYRRIKERPTTWNIPYLPATLVKPTTSMTTSTYSRIKREAPTNPAQHSMGLRGEASSAIAVYSEAPYLWEAPAATATVSVPDFMELLEDNDAEVLATPTASAAADWEFSDANAATYEPTPTSGVIDAISSPADTSVPDWTPYA